MTESNIMSMLHLMGIGNGRLNSTRTRIQASCPFARWKHQRNTDKKPSFSVKIDATGKSVAYCHACGTKGTLLQIAKELDGHAYARNVIDFVKENENYPPDFFKKDNKKFGRRLNWKKAYWLMDDKDKGIIQKPPIESATVVFDEANIAVLPWDTIKPYIKSIPRYVLNRGITKETAKAFMLGYIKKQMCLLIPVIDRKQRLVGYTRRFLFERDDLPKYIHSTGFVKTNFLLGEHLITPERGDIVITEGFFDVGKIYQAGFNALGVMGSSMSEIQAMKVIEMLPEGKKIILMFDNDKAGIKAMNEAYRLLKNDAYVMKRLPPDGKDAGDLTEKQIISLIRTNECK